MYHTVQLSKQFIKTSVRNASTAATKKICICGGGPAGFYAAQYILKYMKDSTIDIIEKLPVPFGLVRFGVAPDHPEVKNVINTFTKTAENPRVRFLGNVSLGKDVTLSELRQRYHSVILTYGADQDRTLQIPNEHIKNVISARDFVAWYNGLPDAANFQPELQTECVSILGQGNVAMDVARILLTPLDELKKTDITSYALDALAASQVKNIHLIGRRGPLQSAFTIKELREILKLPNCRTIWREKDFDGIADKLADLPRPRKRITELMLKSLEESKSGGIAAKTFQPIFFRAPSAVHSKDGCRVDALGLTVTKLVGDKAVATEELETLNTGLVCRSIGYKSISVDSDINFDEEAGCVENIAGRVLKKPTSDATIDHIEDKYETGLYVTGWLATGPTGVILTTMNNAFSVAELVCKDLSQIPVTPKPGMSEEGGKQIVTWDRWLRIDKEEVARGQAKGKSREKIVDVDEMLRVAGY